jgi:hypothetical protein
VIRAREPAGPRPHDDEALPVQRRKRLFDGVFCQLQPEVAEEALDVSDADGFIVVLAIAHALARVIADPPGHRRHGVVLHDRQVPVEETLVLHIVQVLLDLLPGGTGVVTGWSLVAVDGAIEAKVAGRKQLLSGFLGGRGSHAGDGKTEMQRDLRALY